MAPTIMVSMPTIETLLLDAGGVLVVPNWSRVSEILERHGVRVAAEALRKAEPDVKFAIDTFVGVSSSSDAKRWGDYLEGVLKTAGVPLGDATLEALVEIRAYHAANNLWETVPADVVPALDRIREVGLKVAVASNANGTVQRVFDRLGLSAYFDVVCDSHFEGVEKPNPRFFQIVLERSGGDPATTLHVGDLYHVDIVGARNAGLNALLLDRDDQYAGFDVERIRTLSDLADRLLTDTRRG
jgi:HAD superfamily hydrolase (TIGR01549 family)